jgi:hypothetical protein
MTAMPVEHPTTRATTTSGEMIHVRCLMDAFLTLATDFDSAVAADPLVFPTNRRVTGKDIHAPILTMLLLGLRLSVPIAPVDGASHGRSQSSTRRDSTKSVHIKGAHEEERSHG